MLLFSRPDPAVTISTSKATKIKTVRESVGRAERP